MERAAWGRGRISVKRAALALNMSESAIRVWIRKFGNELDMEDGQWRGGSRQHRGRERYLGVQALRDFAKKMGHEDWRDEYLPGGAKEREGAAGVEDEVAELRERMEDLQARLDALEVEVAQAERERGGEGQGAAGGGSGVSAEGWRRERAPTRPLHSTSELPEGLVSWREFTELHGIPGTTVQKAIDDGRLVAIHGEWKIGRVYLRTAFDAAARRQFTRLWGHRPDFRPCDECPHRLPAESGDDEGSVAD